MTDNRIVWEDPSPQTAADGTWLSILAGLLERPETWARVRVTTPAKASATAANLRKGRNKIPPGRWEFATRTLPDGNGAIYARYLGPEDGEG